MLNIYSTDETGGIEAYKRRQGISLMVVWSLVNLPERMSYGKRKKNSQVYKSLPLVLDY